MPRTTTVLIYADEDFEKMAELRRSVGIAERRHAAAQGVPLRGGDEVASDEGVVEAKAEFNDFVDAAAERAETWVLEALGHEEWRTLLANHPPREVEGKEGKELHEDDRDYNVNVTTFGKALLNYRRTDEDGDEFRTVTEPELDEDALRRRIKRLSDGEFETLWTSAYLLNSGGISDPKALRYEITSVSSAT